MGAPPLPKRPKKLAKAQRREARLDARWIAWRDAFFDLIAGKPHLPSLPPLGPSGSAAPDAAAAEPEDRSRRGRRARRSRAGGEPAAGTAREKS